MGRDLKRKPTATLTLTLTSPFLSLDPISSGGQRRRAAGRDGDEEGGGGGSDGRGGDWDRDRRGLVQAEREAMEAGEDDRERFQEGVRRAAVEVVGGGRCDGLGDEGRPPLRRERGKQLEDARFPSRFLSQWINQFLQNEEGIFYGLEMGRTKVRVFRVQLAGKDLGVAKKELMEVPVPINLMVGTSEELYNYLAAELVKFISSSSGNSNMPGAKPREIGCTFSFPVVNSAAHGIHVEWNRGFSIKDSVGRDSLQ